MPNWVCNDIEITGPEADLSHFMSECITTASECVDFDKLIPQPQPVLQSLEETERLTSFLLERRGADLGRREPVEKGQPQPPIWYTWRNENWGTKWNACECYVERTSEGIKLGFRTAWGAPFPIFETIAKRYPALSIKVHYEDFPNFVGESHYHDGQVEHADHTEEMWAANRALFEKDSKVTGVSPSTDDDGTEAPF